ncbi:MAG: putative Zn-dependent protease, partial [Marinoscillum sp.]
VKYLADTPYACNGAASFFQKLLDEGEAGAAPVFLSTHPSPRSRVQDINDQATSIGCSVNTIRESGMNYNNFIASLP